LLLSHVEAEAVTTSSVAEALNTAWEVSEYDMPPMLPLARAATYAGGVLLERMLLHGASHIEQCFRTVHLLLDKGAHVGLVAGTTYSALWMAAELGPPYALQALRTWRGGGLRPGIQDWTECVSMTCIDNNRSTFNELLAMDVVAEEPLSWPAILAYAAQKTDQKHYANAIITKHEGLDPAPADYSRAFTVACLRGHEKVAAAIYARAGRCDVDALTHWPEAEGSRSILGSLIWNARFCPRYVKAIDDFLKLVGARESVFETVLRVERDGSPPTVLNALEFTLLFQPGFNPSAGVDILRVLTKYFKHPAKHLNALPGTDRYSIPHMLLMMGHSFPGTVRYSLLHTVVLMGNPPAADFLLKLRGVDAKCRDGGGVSAFDLCLMRWQDFARNASPAYTNALKAGVPEAEAQEDWETKTRQLMEVMKRRGASKFGSMSHLFKRLSAEQLRVIEVDDEGEFTIVECSEQGKQGLSSPRALIDLTTPLDIRSTFQIPGSTKARRALARTSQKP
jgi:hypothetical protein